jgi:hypothetical protein
MNAVTCPTEAELLAWADKAEGSESLGAHLDSCPDCRQQLFELRNSISHVRLRVEPQPSAGQETSSSLRGLTALGKYLVVGRLGGKRQFESFRGMHPLLHIDLRIDVSLERLSKVAEYREPIAAEVRRLISIEQPHLSRIRDSGYLDDRLYLVADYGPDERLDQRLLNGALDSDEAARIVGPLTRAAVPLANAGIFPREINPVGILLPGEGGPLWTDWGATCLLRSSSHGDAGLPLHQLLACLFIDLVAPRTNARHNPASVRETIGKLRGANQISAATAKALQTALDDPSNSSDALAQLSRNLLPHPGFWTRLFH